MKHNRGASFHNFPKFTKLLAQDVFLLHDFLDTFIFLVSKKKQIIEESIPSENVFWGEGTFVLGEASYIPPPPA